MNENKLFLTIFLAIVTSGLTIFGSIVIYDEYKERKAIREIKEGIEQFTNEMEKLEQERKQKANAKARAEAEAKERARLIALANLKEKIKKDNYLKQREADFESWYEINMPAECREESYGDLNVECINAKIRAEREFKAKY
jgi:hypothetical protein